MHPNIVACNVGPCYDSNLGAPVGLHWRSSRGGHGVTRPTRMHNFSFGGVVVPSYLIVLQYRIDIGIALPQRGLTTQPRGKTEGRSPGKLKGSHKKMLRLCCAAPLGRNDGCQPYPRAADYVLTLGFDVTSLQDGDNERQCDNFVLLTSRMNQFFFVIPPERIRICPCRTGNSSISRSYRRF